MYVGTQWKLSFKPSELDFKSDQSGFQQALEIMETLENHWKSSMLEKSWNLKKPEESWKNHGIL